MFIVNILYFALPLIIVYKIFEFSVLIFKNFYVRRILCSILSILVVGAVYITTKRDVEYL